MTKHNADFQHVLINVNINKICILIILNIKPSDSVSFSLLVGLWYYLFSIIRLGSILLQFKMNSHAWRGGTSFILKCGRQK